MNAALLLSACLAVALSAAPPSPLTPPSVLSQRSASEQRIESKLSADWVLCEDQASGVHVVDSWTFFTTPLPAEQGSTALGGDPYLVYVRARPKAIPDAACYPFAVTISPLSVDIALQSISDVQKTGRISQPEQNATEETVKEGGAVLRWYFQGSAKPGAKALSIRVPAGFVVCSANAPATANAGEATISVPVESQRFAMVVAANAGDCGEAKGPQFDVLATLLPETPTVKEDQLALEWDPAADQQLTILVHSKAVADQATRRILAPDVLGTGPRTGNWTEPCDAVTQTCEYVLKSHVSWKTATTLEVVFRPPQVSERDLYERRLFDLDGQPKTSFPGVRVNRWRMDEYKPRVLQKILWNELERPRLNAPLDEPLLRFYVGDTYDCLLVTTTGSRAVASCGKFRFARGATPPVEFSFPLEDVSAGLKAGGKLEIKLAEPTQVTLIKRDWSPVKVNPKVELKLAQCTWHAQQLTNVSADLNDGGVLFSVTSDKKTSSCPPPTGWSVSTVEPLLALGGTTSLIERELREDAPAAALIWIPIRSIPSVPNMPPELKFSYEGMDIATDAKVLLVVDPRLPLAPVDVWTALWTPWGKEAAGPAVDLDRTSAKAISVGRPTWIHFRTPHPELWALEIEGTNLRPCHALALASRRGNLRLPFREQYVCLEATTTASELAVIAELQGPAAQFKRAEPPAGLRFPELPMHFGYRRIPLPFGARRLDLALPLKDSLLLTCRNAEYPGGVRVGSATRAVDFGQKNKGDGCELNVGFPLKAEERIGLVRCAKDETCQTGVARSVYRRALRTYGPQKLKVTMRVSNDEGKTWSEWIEARSGALSLPLDAPPEARVDSGFRTFLEEPWAGVHLQLGLLEDGRLKMEDYGLVEIRVSHANPSDYLPTEEEPASRTDNFEVRVRKMPKNNFPGFAGKKDVRAYGVRGYLSFGNPAVLVRTANPGFTAKASSEFNGWQPAVIGAAVLYVVEAWNFDDNEPLLPFNPQLHAGALISASLTSLTGTRPRFSGVAGLGLRVPGSSGPSSAMEVSTGLLVWLEVTEGLRQPVVDALIGYKVTFGSWGN
ncbi:MAG TPA: hypothetical protein VGK67_39745 [Myxococcales bacterium]|jgi:hypothetical protein